MKKLLTLAAGALIGLSASLPADAATVPCYTKGTAIPASEQLTTGKYFIYAYSRGAGRFVHKASGFMADMGLATIPEAGITDASYVYDITVDNNGRFTIANNGALFPILGANAEGKGNITVANAAAEGATTAAQFTRSTTPVVGTPAEFVNANILSYVQLANGFYEGNSAKAAYFHTNVTNNIPHLSYWEATGNISTASSTAVAFYPVTAGTVDLTAEDKYFLIKNVRTSKYIQAHTGPGVLSQINANALNATSDRYDTGSLWSFVADAQAPASEGYTAVKICNPLKPGQTLASVDPETWNTENTTWYISDTESTHSGSGHTGFTISKQAAPNTNGWNDDGGATVCYWSNNDGGSKWIFEIADADKVTATLEAITGVLQTKFDELKAQGTLIANMTGIPADRKTDWETATGSLTTYSEDNWESLKAAYGALVNDLHVKFQSCKADTDWISQKDGDPQRWNGGDGSRIFTLKNAGGVGFYVLNEYLQKYIVHPTADNTKATFNADKNSATIYNIDIFFEDTADHSRTKYGVFSMLSTVPDNRKYWHSNGSHEIWRWGADNNSSWYVSFAEDAAAANEDLEGAKHPIITGYTIGVNLGQFHYTEEFTNQRDNVQADTPEEKRDAATTLRGITPIAINQPVAGRFYRFRYGSQYLSSTLASNGRFALETETITNGNSNLNNTTVFYYNGTRLVTYPEGLVMGDMSVTPNNLNGVLSTANNAGTIRFAASSFEIGKYNITSRNSTETRYLYHSPGNDRWVDAGGSGAANSNNVGYRWEIVEVTWLPIPYSGEIDGYFSVCVPVDLDIAQYSRAEDYTGVIQGSNLGLQEIVGGTLPANTPAVLKYKGGADNNCVYFRIIYPEIETAAADVTNSLTDTNIFATPTHDEGQSYFTVDGARFMPHTSGNLPAFSAILKLPTDQARPEGYAIADYDPSYTSISEIESADNNGKQVIYDLQGRRVQRASKGIYIINGVKTIVK